MVYLFGFIFIVYAMGVVGLCCHVVHAWIQIRGDRGTRPVPAGDRSWPSLDVVLPVKDEVGNIAGCIESVLAQNYPQAHIIVVNDRSTDGTVEAVRKVQCDDPEVELVNITDLPPGLYGKPHALHGIADRLRGDYVAFVDSDLRLQSDCLTTLVDRLICRRLDWVAAMGRPQLSFFWERLLVPLLGAVTYGWYDPRKISNPNWPNAIGSGLMVCRRDAYAAIGGHGAVIDVYDEDSELIRIAKRAGQKVSFLVAPELFTQRHYGSLADTIHGITRTCIGGIKTVPRFLITIYALNFVSILPFALLAVLGAVTWLDWPLPWRPGWWTAGLVHLTVSSFLFWLIYSTAKADRRFAWLHPIGSSLLIGICIRAMVHMRRGKAITWRGTTHPTPGVTP